MHSKLVGWIFHPKHILKDIPSMLRKSMDYPVTPSPNTTEIYPMHPNWMQFSWGWKPQPIESTNNPVEISFKMDLI